MTSEYRYIFRPGRDFNSGILTHLEPPQKAPENEFWHISYFDADQNGHQLIAMNEQHARSMAQLYSIQHGTANILNINGIFATYIKGSESSLDQFLRKEQENQ